MKFALILAVLAFSLGCIVGAAVERACYHHGDGGRTLVYNGAVYVRAIEGTSLEDYLTAAGKRK